MRRTGAGRVERRALPARWLGAADEFDELAAPRFVRIAA
jgi:hypothetical protein